MRKFAGFSLLELVVAMTIFCCIAASCMLLINTFVVISKKQQKILEISENILLVKHFFIQDFTNLTAVKLRVPVCAVASCKDTLSSSVCNKIKSDSDVIMLHKLGADYGLVKINDNNQFVINDVNCKALPDKLILVSNNEVVEHKIERCAQVQNNALISLTEKTQWKVKCINSLLVGTSERLFYYLAKTRRFYANGEPIYALYRKEDGARSEEVVCGIETFNCAYALVGGDGWVSAKEVLAWADVIAVRFKLQFVMDKKVENDFNTLILEFWW